MCIYSFIFIVIFNNFINVSTIFFRRRDTSRESVESTERKPASGDEGDYLYIITTSLSDRLVLKLI